MKPEMTLGEIVYYYCVENDIMPEFVRVSHDAIIVRDPRYNDLSKPGFALAYNFTNNTIICTKIDNKWHPIVGDTTREIANDEVKDVKTFLDFVSYINKYCEEYNCDYETALDNESTPAICVKSPYDPGQVIIYDKQERYILFIENETMIRFLKNKTIDDFLSNETDITTFAKESFEFCEENKCSFADYAKEIALNILQLKSVINDFCDRHNSQEKLLYTSFDKDGKTAFMYHDNKIKYFKISEDDVIDGVLPDDTGSIKNIKTFEEFKEFIKINRESIDNTINENVESTKKRLKTSEVEEYENYKDVLDNFADHDKEMGK